MVQSPELSTRYSFTAVPLDPATFLAPIRSSPTFSAAPASSIPASLPASPLANSIITYAKEHLPEPTFNHSMRVYHYGLAIASHHFATLSLSAEAYLIASLLHDIGTTPTNISSALLSFEFHGGIIAHDLLTRQLDAPRPLADAVTEAIIRHQDLGVNGKITLLGQVLQLATTLDNVGLNRDIVNDEVVKVVMERYPRLKWSGCFVDVIRKEVGLKPWAHTTALGEEEFPAKVLGNTEMNALE